MALSPKDHDVIRGWAMGRASMAEIDATASIGLVGNVRFSEAARRRFALMWEWSTFRYSSHAQDVYWNRHGREAFYRRMARVRRMAEWYGARFADKL